MPRPGFLLLLAAAAAAALTPSSLAGGSGVCEPIKGVLQAQLQATPGALAFRGIVEGTLGGAPVVGSAVSELSIPPEGLSGVTNPVPTEGGAEMEVVDTAKTEPPKSFATTDSGMLIPTPQTNVFLLVIHARVTGNGSGEIHYQGIVDLATSTASWEMSGGICLD